MKCPICNDDLDQQDEELVCQGCGATYGLQYLGVYEELGINERVDSGFESEKWKEKYGEKFVKYKEENPFSFL